MRSGSTIQGTHTTAWTSARWLCRLGARSLVSVLLVSAPVGSARAQAGAVSDDERREAGCIDYYNDPGHVDPDEVGFRRNSALIRVRAEGDAGAASDGDTAVPRRLGFGGRVDVDLPVLVLLSGGGTDTGISSGVTAIVSSMPDRSRIYTGELRLGLARRRYGVAWSGFYNRCRLERTDLGLDFVRWRAGAFTDLTIPGNPTSFVSSIGFPGLTYRSMYPNFGFSWTATLLEFRLAPSFEWGTSGGIEFYLWHVLVGLTAGFHFLPDQAFYVALGLGAEFEVGGVP